MVSAAFSAVERAWAILLFVIVLACIGGFTILGEVAEEKDRLQQRAQSFASVVSQKLAEGTTLVSALFGYYQSAGEMPAERFPLLAERFIAAHPQVSWVGYATRVDFGEVDYFQDLMQLEGFINFRIAGFANGSPSSETYHLPFNLLEPLEPSMARILGSDLLTHPGWSRALGRAIRSGRTVAAETDGISDRSQGILLLRATYRGTVEPGSEDTRVRQLAGVIMLFMKQEALIGMSAELPAGHHIHLSSAEFDDMGHVSLELLSENGGGGFSPSISTNVPIGVADLRRNLVVHARLRPSMFPALASMAIALVPLLAVIVAVRSRRIALRAERSAYAQARLAEATLGSIDDAVVRVSESGQVRYLNPKAREMTGRSLQPEHQLDIAEVLPFSGSEGKILDWSQLRTALDAGTALSFVDVTGARFMLSGTLAPVVGEHRDADGYVLALRDVTREHELATELMHQASHDPLTELPNRRAFERHLLCAVEDAQATDSVHTLLYVDLDQFKLVNDTCGHAAGDEMLRQLSGLLAAECRSRDVLARLGGDEFGVLLRDCAVVKATPIAQRICDTVAEFRFTWDGRAFELGASIGVVAVSATSGTADDVQRAADLACYAAKDMGRNRYHIYLPEDRIIARNESDMKWQTEIKRAIEEHRLVLHGQPIVALRASCTPHGLSEILLRMRGHDGELIPPRAFIPAAERYGLMKQLDREVVRLAFEYLSATPDDGVVRSINLSGQTITDPGFEAFVVRASAECELDPTRVCFEITETSAISNMNIAINLMRRLGERGFAFALDDFGAGLSSLSYLKQLPINYLKIDGQFIRDLEHDAVARSMVSSIVNVADVLGIQCIAEMVEDAGTQRRLSELGVDYAQGFHLGRPKPLVNIVARALSA